MPLTDKGAQQVDDEPGLLPFLVVLRYVAAARSERTSGEARRALSFLAELGRQFPGQPPRLERLANFAVTNQRLVGAIGTAWAAIEVIAQIGQGAAKNARAILSRRAQTTASAGGGPNADHVKWRAATTVLLELWPAIQAISASWEATGPGQRDTPWGAMILEAVASSVLTKPGHLSAATLRTQLPRWLAGRRGDLKDLDEVLSEIGSRTHPSWRFRPVGRPRRAIGYAIKMVRRTAGDIVEKEALGADPVVSPRTLRRYRKKGLLTEDGDLDAKPKEPRKRRQPDPDIEENRDLHEDDDEEDEAASPLNPRTALLLAVRLQQAQKQKHAADGFSVRQAAAELGLAESTVRFLRDKAGIPKDRRLTRHDLDALAAASRRNVNRTK